MRPRGRSKLECRVLPHHDRLRLRLRLLLRLRVRRRFVSRPRDRPPDESESELDPEPESESESDPELELELEDPEEELPLARFGSFPVSNFSLSFCFASKIRSATPSFFLNSSGSSTDGLPSFLIFSSTRGFSSCCVREGRETYGRSYLHS